MVASLTQIDPAAASERRPGPAAAALERVERQELIRREERAELVEVQLSEQARTAQQPQGADNPTVQAFAHALAQGLNGLGRTAKSMFTLLGMTPGRATLAVGALTQAIRGAAGAAGFQAEILSFAASGRPLGGDVDSYRASLIIQKAGLAWDPASREFVVTLRQMSLSIGLDQAMALVPRGLPAPAAGMEPVIQFDATIPLDFPKA